MSNLTVNQRNQLEKYELGYTGDRLTRATAAQQRVFTVLTVVFLGVLGLLTYAAIQVFDGWPHLIVLGDMVLVFFGIAAWVYPKRKRVY